MTTFVRTCITWSAVKRSPPDSNIEWLVTEVQETTIVNVYKPPPSELYPTPGVTSTANTQTGVIDRLQRMVRRWSTGHPVPKQCYCMTQRSPPSFFFARWNTYTNPDLAFAVGRSCDPKPERRIIDRVPRSHHRPSIIKVPSLVQPIAGKPVKRWNFRKANWELFTAETERRTPGLPNPQADDADATYTAYCNMLICAAKKSITRGFNKDYIPGWDDSSNHLLREHQQATTKEDIDTTATALLHKLDEVRRATWTEVVESVDFTQSSRKAWQTINKLTGRSMTHSRCPVTANAIASNLLNNGRFPDADRDFARWTSREVTSLSRAATADANLSSDFTVEELEAAIKNLKSGKAPGRDNIHPEFVIHQSAKTTAWLCSFFTSCFRRSKLPKTWRRATVVALPTFNDVA